MRGPGVGAAPLSLRLRVEAAAGRVSVGISTSSDVFNRGILGDPRLLQILRSTALLLYGKSSRFESAVA